MYGLPPSLASGVIGLVIGMLLLQLPMIFGQIVSAFNQRFSSKIQAETSRRIASGTVETSTAGELQAWERGVREYLDKAWRDEVRQRQALEERVRDLIKQVINLEAQLSQQRPP